MFAGHMREQVCTYMCPWPRIQGAMLDDHSLQVTYRYDRGETRGPHKKGQSWEGRGDCIDCHACVVACPMGIDIRNGPQLECINCGLCIDACDEIMDRVGRPRALIAYDTDAAVAARARREAPVYRFVRSRTIYYGAALLLVSGLVGWGLMNRSPLDLHALRDRNPTFVRLHDGAVRNGYTLKIANRTFHPQTLQVDFRGVAGARLRMPGEPAGATVTATIPANEVRAVRVFVMADPADDARESLPAAFVIRGAGRAVEAKTTFITGTEAPR
jgi:cytochrome c oxidase accessory protein FixG